MIGTTVSHYRLLEKLGSGGMGVVYKAHDTRLDRPVALKFVSERISGDPSALQRFEREARTTSALNHPGICTVYEIDDADGQTFIAMEYLEGQSLRDRLAAGRLPVDEVLDLGMQIADALHAAHARGICHRDIKPANIFVTADGRAKLLDFGLAKFDAGGRGAQSFQTTLSPVVSSAGAVVGTAAYMSPEQALGRPVDQRSDLFSFGLVLYEMATGRRALSGTMSTLLDSILNAQPVPASSLVADLPPQFDQIVEKALEKDPEVRYQAAADLRADLRRLRRVVDSQASGHLTMTRPIAAQPGRAALVPRAAMAAGVAFGAALLAFIVLRIWPFAAARPFLADASFMQLTDQPGVEAAPDMSPDGKSVVYASRVSGNWDVYLQRVDGKTSINLTQDSPADDTAPAFSPDGGRMAFRSEREGGGIFIMGATGESVRRVSDSGYTPAWSRDGRFLAVATEPVDIPTIRWSNSALWIIDVETGQKRELTTGDAVQPRWSPHGWRIAYWLADDSGHRDIRTIAVTGGQPVNVTSDAYLDWNPVWSPDGGYLFFSSNRGGAINLWRVRIDERTGAVLAPPEPITTPSANAAFISFAADGSRIAYLHQTFTRNVVRLLFDLTEARLDERPVPITRGTHYLRNPDLSPDGEWLTYSQDDKIMVVRIDGSRPRQLTEGTYNDRGPRWSPDGQRLAFYSNRSGLYQLWVIRRDGSGLQQVTDQPKTEGLYYPVWSPDGAKLMCSSLEGKAYVVDVSRPSMGALPALAPLPQGDRAFVAWSWSRDGGRLAGWQQRKDGTTAGVVIYDPRSAQFTAVTDFGNYPAWIDDHRLLFSGRNHLNLVELASGMVQELPTPVGFDEEFALSRDGRSVYYTENQREGDVWLIRLSGGGAQRP